MHTTVFKGHLHWWHVLCSEKVLHLPSLLWAELHLNRCRVGLWRQRGRIVLWGRRRQGLSPPDDPSHPKHVGIFCPVCPGPLTSPPFLSPDMGCGSFLLFFQMYCRALSSWCLCLPVLHHLCSNFHFSARLVLRIRCFLQTLCQGKSVLRRNTVNRIQIEQDRGHKSKRKRRTR